MAARRATPYLIGLALAATLLAAFFGPVLWGGQVYYTGDIARIYHPQRVALAQSLAQGRLPWWLPQVGIGYPMLAEGEIGALYPLNWPLYALLSPERALSLAIVFHYLLAGLGMYTLGRTLALTRAGAGLAGLVYALGGFNIAHLSHISILSAAAWLPWLLTCTLRLLAPAATVGAAPRGCPAPPDCPAPPGSRATGHLRWPWAALALWMGALALGALLALPQLLPAAELSSLSQRAGGLEGEFFTSYSFHPLLAATLASPFLQGPPHPEGSIELMGYLGLLPLALAWLALWRPRPRRVWLFAALAALGLFLALGRWNPLYALLSHVPVLNLFRVPARYLLWTSLGLAVLSGYGLSRLEAQAAPRADRLGLGLAGAALLALAAVAGATLTASGVETLVDRWRWIPLALAVATAALLLATRRLPRRFLAALALLIVGVDLYAYGVVLGRTYNQTAPIAEVRQPPRLLPFLDGANGPYRVYTKPEILPILSVQRQSLYPNIALAHGQASANLYLPLVPRHYGAYLDALAAGDGVPSPAERLNRLNVRYYLIPQLLPVDEASELYDVLNPFAAIPYGQWHPLELRGVAAIQVESYVSHAADLADGALAAELLLQPCGGEVVRLPLRVGLETAEWAYARSDVAANVRHSLPPIATSFAARSGFPPEDHPGYTYQAAWELPASMDLCGLRIEPALPEAFVRIERVRLLTQGGEAFLAAHLLGLGDHAIIYRSEDVLVYENQDALPRAYALPLAQVSLSADGAQLPPGSLQPHLIPAQIVTDDAQVVVIEVTTQEPALLVLADLHYPGWHATLDGQPVEIVPVDQVFRGVVLAPGVHQVRFSYPRPW
jgi:hypothetical protein